jgi:hypothetical protein
MQIEIIVWSVLVDLSDNMLMMGIESHPDISTTVCSSHLPLGCECADIV